MRKSRLIFTSLLISGLLATQVMAEAEVPDSTAPQENAASPVITAGQGAGGSTAGLSTATSTPSTVYPPADYQAGVNIPAGEYVLLAQSSDTYGYYAIFADSSAEADLVDYNVFDYNAIIRIEDGQRLELKCCTASPIEEISQIDHYYGTMYKIGYHIPAGTYRLKATDSTSYGIAYVLSYPSDEYDAVEDYVYVEDTAAITVSAGQYLQLDDCVIIGTAPADEVTPDHGSRRTSWADTIREELSADDNQRTSPVVTAGTLIPGLPAATSSPSTVYSETSYQAGVNIPAGEYVLFSSSDEYASGYAISSSPAPETEASEDVVEYGSFQYNTIIKLEDGQYLTMSDCTASPIAEVPAIDYRKGDHFKVGYHIPAGTYYFKSNAPYSYGVAYVLSAPTRRNEDLVDYVLIYSNEDIVPLTLEEGQYLLLANCSFTTQTSGQSGPDGGNSSSYASTWEKYLNYLKQLLGYEEEETASPVVTAPRKSHNLPGTTTTPTTVYPAGTYQAGVNIPAGEYMLLTDNPLSDEYYSSYSGSYIISTVEEPETYEEIIDYNYFSYNAIVRIEDGQYLYLSDCTASPVDEVKQLDYRRSEMYKVGLHVPAGTYGLSPAQNSYGTYYTGRCYVLSYPSDNADAVIESISVAEDGASVTVTNGQYLQLKTCILTDAYESDTSSTGPAFAPPQQEESQY